MNEVEVKVELTFHCHGMTIPEAIKISLQHLTNNSLSGLVVKAREIYHDEKEKED